MNQRLQNLVRAPLFERKRPLWHRRLAVERLEDRRVLAILFEQAFDDPVRALVPTEAEYDDLGFDWLGSSDSFDDSSWAVVFPSPNGVGYDRGSGSYESAIGLDVESQMYGQATSIFTRAEFAATEIERVGTITLRLRYDDGFIAWLNGQEVARANASGVYPAWDAVATAEHEAIEQFSVFDISAYASSLVNGANVLAIRQFNESLTSDDALIEFTLIGESRTGPPVAVNDLAETVEGQPVTIDVLSNDHEGSDPFDPDAVSIATHPVHGTAIAQSNGTITYTPAEHFHGPDTFTYTARDTSDVGQPTTRTLVGDTNVRVLVPTSNTLLDTWRGANEPFNDSAWVAGLFGVGYDTNPSGVDFSPYYRLNVGAMRNVNTTIYMRSTFTIADPEVVTNLTLRMRYDDGFVAFINGVQIASASAPATLEYNSRALSSQRPDANAIIYESFDASPYVGALRIGENILAIHGLNGVVDSSDLLMQPQLTAVLDPRGQVSNIATVSVDVASVNNPPIAVTDHYDVDENQILAIGNPAGSGPTNQMLVPAGSVWRYRDTGILPPPDAQAETWKEIGYDDLSWQSGAAELGYGDGGEATIVVCGPIRPACNANNHITTWFRHHFSMPQGSLERAESLAIELLRDDGGAVYLNGVEIVRAGLPGVLGDDRIGPLTLATSTVGGVDEGRYDPPVVIDLRAPRYRDLLREGNNVLAVEIHQDRPDSTDISFNLRMSATFRNDGGVLANDTDPDGDALTAVLQTPPANGGLEFFPDGTFTYLPNEGFFGNDTFTYRALDGTNTSLPAAVTVAVRHPAPVAGADSYQVNEDTPLAVTVAIGVLANDTDSLEHPLMALLVAAPSYGSLLLSADGGFVYTPQANYHGNDSFTYRATDDAGMSAVADVSISVASVSDLPRAVDDFYRSDVDEPLVISVPGAHLPRDPTIATFDTAGTPYTATQFGSAPGAYETALPGDFGRGLVLTQATNVQSNMVAFDRTAEGAYAAVTADFDFRIQPGGAEAADGFGFVLLSTREYGVTGASPNFNAEDPNVSGSLAIGFDIYANDGLESRNHLSVHYNGLLFERFDIVESVANLDDGQFFHAQLRFQFNPAGVVITAILSRAGREPVVAINGVLVPGVAPYESRVVLAGRTGASTATQQVDNLNVQYSDPAPGEQAYPSALVPLGALWRYVDDGSDQGIAWRQPDFSDAGWAINRAELGYGEGDEATVIRFGSDPNNRHATTYFRHRFNVDDVDRIVALKLHLKRDDGAAVFLNGVEIARDNLPADAIYSTYTGVSALDDGQTLIRFANIDPNLLIEGENVLAVEIHQATANSGDLSFDARLTATVEPHLGVLANDIDGDEEELQAMLVAAPMHGALQLAENGIFVYTPNTGFAGVDRFTYRTLDGQAAAQPATVTIVVSPPDKAPEDLNADGAVNEGDVAFLLRSFGKTSRATVIEGDLDGNQKIGVPDLIRLQRALSPAKQPAAKVVAASQRDEPGLNAVRRVRTPDERVSIQAVDEALSTMTGRLVAKRARARVSR